ncbi:MAG: hypothetical protein KKA84_10660 [Bacteroidetes bacterium]|nr:hypothetical protein [Bacteroidota bacterium]
MVSNDLNETVIGVILYGNDTYLVTPRGYINVAEDDINKQSENYYRQVYGDSTIVNPNLIINPANDSNILHFITPFIGLDSESEYLKNLPQGCKLIDFMSVNENGEFVFRRGIYGLINKMLSDERNE